MAKHTPTPWSVCNNGECPCLMIGCPDHPIAEVVSGEWGDEYPAIRLTEGSTIEAKAEAYMERSIYGTIDTETARANALFIVEAVNNHARLTASLSIARKALESYADRSNYDCPEIGGWARAERALEEINQEAGS